MEQQNQDSFDPLETKCIRSKKKTIDETSENTSKKSILDEVVNAIFPRIKKPIGILIGIAENETTPIKLKRKETQEQGEKRLLKMRILSQKRRLLKQLEMPSEFQAFRERLSLKSRRCREKKLAKETPEEAALRLQKNRNAAAASKIRAQEFESREELAERFAKQNEKRKLKYQEMIAKETPEQRAARRERDRLRHQRNRAPLLAMRTGLMRKKAKRKSNLNIDNESITN